MDREKVYTCYDWTFCGCSRTCSWTRTATINKNETTCSKKWMPLRNKTWINKTHKCNCQLQRLISSKTSQQLEFFKIRRVHGIYYLIFFEMSTHGDVSTDAKKLPRASAGQDPKRVEVGMAKWACQIIFIPDWKNDMMMISENGESYYEWFPGQRTT